jgi:hypothetical protein
VDDEDVLVIGAAQQFRGLAFPIPTPGMSYEIQGLEVARDALVRARVLLDTSFIEEMCAPVLSRPRMPVGLSAGIASRSMNFVDR